MRRLHNALFILFAAASLIPLCLVGVILGRNLNQFLVETTEKRNESINLTIGSAFEKELTQREILLREALTQLTTEGNDTARQGYLERFLQRHPTFDAALLLDLEGTVLEAEFPADSKLSTSDFINIDLSNHNAFTQAVEGQTYHSSQSNSVLTSKNSIFMSTRKDNRVLILQFPIEYLRRFLDKAHASLLQSGLASEDIHITILDPLATNIFTTGKPPSTDRESLRHIPAVEGALQGNWGSYRYQLDGQNTLGHIQKLAPLDWMVLVQAPQSVAYRALRQIRRNLLTGAVLSLAIGILAAFVFGHLIHDPLRKLQAKAEAIGKGQFVPTDTSFKFTEFNSLAQTLRQMATDLSERETLLKRSRERYEYLFLAGSDMLFTHGVDDRFNPARFEEVNDIACRTLGYSREEILAMTPRDVSVFYHQGEDEAIIERLRKDKFALFEVLLRRKDGTQLPVEIHSHVFRYEERWLGIAVARDITERKRAQEKLILAKEEAEAANRAKSEFLNVMSHELRTPLNAVLGFSSLLAEESQSPHARQYSSQIQQSGQHLLNLIDNILDFARLASNRVEFSYQPVDTQKLVQSVADTTQLLISQASKPIELKVTWHSPVPPFLILEPTRLRQILTNLTENAVKFTSEGFIHLGISLLAPTNAKPAFIEFCVADSGSGIPPDAIDRIWNPFEQVDTSITRKFGGTGLGLAVCRYLTEKMNGEIECRSPNGKGAEFTLRLPYSLSSTQPTEPGEISSHPNPSLPASSPHPHKPTPEAPTNASAPEKTQGPPSTRPRIICAEDNYDNRAILEVMLNSLGYSCTLVNDGRELLETLEADPHDIVLMDIQMPHLDGLAATRMIREGKAGQSLRALPIIGVSAWVGDEHRDRALRAGMNAFVIKPIDIRLLDKSLKSYWPR